MNWKGTSQRDMTNQTPVDCVGVICFRGEDVLLIKRGKPPRLGDWSLPGGRIEAGETEADAALRELNEETGVTAALGPKVLTLPAHFEGTDYVLHDYVAEWMSGDVVAGDDAAHAEFMPTERLDDLGMWDATRKVIETAREARGRNGSLKKPLGSPRDSG